jgi:hypothetical protein
VILAVQVTQPGVTTEAEAAITMLDELGETGLLANVDTLAADGGYGSTAFVTQMLDRGITPHTPLRADPAIEPVPAWKRTTTNPGHQRKRNEKVKQAQARNYVRRLAHTAAYKRSHKLRKRIEHIFAEAKVCHGLDRARCRELRAMQEQLVMTAVVQNIKRLVKYMRKNQKQVAAVNAKTACKRPFSCMFRSYGAKIREISCRTCSLPPEHTKPGYSRTLKPGFSTSLLILCIIVFGLQHKLSLRKENWRNPKTTITKWFIGFALAKELAQQNQFHFAKI